MSTVTRLHAITVTVELEDTSVDLICFEYAMSILRDRTLAGKLKGYVEATFIANPGLAALAPVLPRGTQFTLPEFVIDTEAKTKRLWDE